MRVHFPSPIWNDRMASSTAYFRKKFTTKKHYFCCERECMHHPVVARGCPVAPDGFSSSASSWWNQSVPGDEPCARGQRLQSIVFFYLPLDSWDNDPNSRLTRLQISTLPCRELGAIFVTWNGKWGAWSCRIASIKLKIFYYCKFYLGKRIVQNKIKFKQGFLRICISLNSLEGIP